MTTYGARFTMALQDTGPAGDPGPGANEPAGFQKFAANPFATVTPRTWSLGDQTDVAAVDTPVGMTTDSGKALQCIFRAGTYTGNLDPCNTLVPENSVPLWSAPTAIYIRYKQYFPSDYVQWGLGSPPNGDRNTKHWYTQATQSDMYDAAPFHLGAGLTYMFTTGTRSLVGSEGADTTSPMFMCGAWDFILSGYDPYYNSGAGKEVSRNGYTIPDLEVDESDLTIAYSASGAFQATFSDGLPIDGSAYYITGAPFAKAGAMLPITIDHWIDAHHIQLTGSAMIAQFDGDETGVAGPMSPGAGAVSVSNGIFAPFIGDEGGLSSGVFYPNVPPNNMVTSDDVSIPAGAEVVRGQTYDLEYLYVLNSSASGTGAAADGIARMWMNGTLIIDWKFKRASLLGRLTDVWFTQQVPMGGTFASDYTDYFGDMYLSAAAYRDGEAPKQYNLATADTPTHGTTITVTAQLVDYNGEAVRAPFQFNATATGSMGSITATGGATVEFGGSGYVQGSVNGLLTFTVDLPAGVGVPVTVTVTDLGSPARTGTLDLTTV